VHVAVTDIGRLTDPGRRTADGMAGSMCPLTGKRETGLAAATGVTAGGGIAEVSALRPTSRECERSSGC
jgi:hypothetical protein